MIKLIKQPSKTPHSVFFFNLISHILRQCAMYWCGLLLPIIIIPLHTSGSRIGQCSRTWLGLSCRCELFLEPEGHQGLDLSAVSISTEGPVESICKLKNLLVYPRKYLQASRQCMIIKWKSDVMSSIYWL